MSEELTKNMSDGQSFEERVFARFDSLDARLQTLETQAERRALETKPIWERALAEILEVRESVANVERKIDILSRDIVQVRADQSRVENRIDKLESSPSS
jgi:hypothetical protein